MRETRRETRGKQEGNRGKQKHEGNKKETKRETKGTAEGQKRK